MSGWNYRVVKELTKGGFTDYAVHEVHYDENDAPYMMTTRDVSPAGEDAAEFAQSLVLWNRALEKPVLVYDDKKHKFVGEQPPISTPPPCPDCGRPMVRREPWTCATCGEESEL